MRISDWSSDVCSSDLGRSRARRAPADVLGPPGNTDHELAAPSALAMAQSVTSMSLPRGRLECAADVRVRAPPLAVRAADLVRADDAGVLHDAGGAGWPLRSRAQSAAADRSGIAQRIPARCAAVETVSALRRSAHARGSWTFVPVRGLSHHRTGDRKSTRLNSRH